MDILVIIKFVSLCVGIAYGFSNIAKVILMSKGKAKEGISGYQLIFMVVGIVLFAFIQFKLY